MDSNNLHVNSQYTSIPNSDEKNSNDNIKLDSNSSSTSTTPTKIKIITNDDVVIDMSNVQEEDNLAHYTDNHFMSLSNKDLERVRNMNATQLIIPENKYLQYNATSNSPVLSVLDSNHGSRSNSNSNSDNESELVEINDINYDSNNKLNEPTLTNPTTLDNTNIPINRKSRHRNKLNYVDVEQSINKYYPSHDNSSFYSSEIDVLLTFVKGQKNLYIQSKHIIQQKLNCLVIPAIFLSAFITIIAPFVECKSWNVGIISGLNAIVTLFISLTKFLQYETSVEKFSLLAALFDNIEISLDLSNSKLKTIQQESEATSIILSKFNEVENKICDYKLIYTVLIPEEIKTLFPVISHINVFSFIKKTELHRKKMIEKLCNIKNEIYYILYRRNKEDRILRRKLQLTLPPTQTFNYDKKIHGSERIDFLYKLKDQTTDELYQFKNVYHTMDTIYAREILFAEQNRNKSWFCLLCYYLNPPTLTYDYFSLDRLDLPPILYRYFQDILNEYLPNKKH